MAALRLARHLVRGLLVRGPLFRGLSVHAAGGWRARGRSVLLVVGLLGPGLPGLTAPRAAYAQFTPQGRRRPSPSTKESRKANPAKGREAGAESGAPSQLSPQTYAAMLRFPGQEAPFRRMLNAVAQAPALLRELEVRLNQDAVSLDPQLRYAALVVLGRLRAHRGEGEAALTAFRAARSQEPGRGEAYFAEAALSSGDAHRQREVLQGAEGQLSGEDERRLLERLRALSVELGDIHRARGYSRALSSGPGGVAELFEFVVQLTERGLWRDAQAELELGLTRPGVGRADTARLHLELARVALQLGEAGAAREHLARARVAAAGDAPRSREIFRLDLEVSRALGALGEFAARAAESRDLDVALLAVEAYEELGQASEAGELLLAWRRKQPQNVALQRLEAEFWERTGAVERAARAYTSLADDEPSNSVPAQRAIELWLSLGDVEQARQRLVVLAKRATSTADMRASLDICERVGTTELCQRLEGGFENSGDASLLFELSERNWERGDAQAAKKTWERALARQPSWDLRLRWADTLVSHGEVQDAFSVYESLARASLSREQRLALALGYARLQVSAESKLKDEAGRRAEAEFTGLLEGAASAEERAAVARRIVEIWARTDRLDREIERLNAADSTDVGTISILVEAFGWRREGELELEALRKYETLAPGDGFVSARRARAEAARRMASSTSSGRRDAAAPPSVEAAGKVEDLLELARMARRAGRLSEARDSYRRYLTRSSSDAVALQELADTLVAQGDYEGAEATLEGVLLLEPRRRDVRLALAELKVRRGDPSAARELFFRVLAEGPRPDEVARASRRLRALAALLSGEEYFRFAQRFEGVLLGLYAARASQRALAAELVAFYEACLEQYRRSRDVPSSPGPASEAARASERRFRYFAAHALAPLVQILDRDAALAGRAVALLGRLDEPLADRALLQFALKGGDRELRKRALLSLRGGSATNRAELEAVLRGPLALDPDLAPHALWAWLRAGGASESAVLVRALESTNVDVRTLALYGLARARLAVPETFHPRARREKLALALALARGPRVHGLHGLEGLLDTPDHELRSAGLFGLALAGRSSPDSWLDARLRRTAAEALVGGGPGAGFVLVAFDPTRLQALDSRLDQLEAFDAPAEGPLVAVLERWLTGGAPPQLTSEALTLIQQPYVEALAAQLTKGGEAARLALALLDPLNDELERPPSAAIPQLLQALTREYWQLLDDPSEELFSAWLRALSEATLTGPEGVGRLRRALGRLGEPRRERLVAWFVGRSRAARQTLQRALKTPWVDNHEHEEGPLSP